MSNQDIFSNVKTELEKLVKTKQTLLVLMGIDAIENNELEEWIKQVQAQVNNGFSGLIERTTSENMVRLIKECVVTK